MQQDIKENVLERGHTRFLNHFGPFWDWRCLSRLEVTEQPSSGWFLWLFFDKIKNRWYSSTI